MDVVAVPDAELQIRNNDGWWRDNRTAAPGLFAEELAATVELIASAPNIGRRRRQTPTTAGANDACPAWAGILRL